MLSQFESPLPPPSFQQEAEQPRVLGLQAPDLCDEPDLCDGSYNQSAWITEHSPPPAPLKSDWVLDSGSWGWAVHVCAEGWEGRENGFVGEAGREGQREGQGSGEAKGRVTAALAGPAPAGTGGLLGMPGSQLNLLRGLLLPITLVRPSPPCRRGWPQAR